MDSVSANMRVDVSLAVVAIVLFADDITSVVSTFVVSSFLVVLKFL